MYTVFVRDVINDKTYELPFVSFNFTEELNKGANGTFFFNHQTIDEILSPVNLDALFLFSAGLREISVEKDGTRIYLGFISDMGEQMRDDGHITMDIASIDTFSMLSRRRTGAKKVFVQEDVADIILELINDSQNSDTPYSALGITEGLLQESKPRDRTLRFAQIKDEIWKLTNDNRADGVDVEINAQKQLNVFSPAKGTERNVFLDEKNIQPGWSFRKPLLTSLANRVHVLGEGLNDDRVHTTRTSDVAFRETFGLLEDVLSEPDTAMVENLEDKGDKYLEENQAPKIELVIPHLDDDPDILTYSVGDSLKVTFAEAGIDNEYKRVYRRTLSVDENGLGTVNLLLR